MAKKINRTCILCGAKYSFCPTCGEDSLKPAWNAIYESDNCRKIFTAASDYCGGEITKEEAKLIFDSCDISNKNNFEKSVLKVINEIYEETDSKVKNIEEDVITEEKASEEVEVETVVVKETDTTKKSKFRRKK